MSPHFLFMQPLLVIVVYNRTQDLQHWFDCWAKCLQDAHMVVIHTGPDAIKVPDGVTYIHRENIGYDIGCLQDVCKERLPGFPNNWDKMLWCTDDVFPMQVDFLSKYFSQLTENVGCVAMEISPYKRTHIRTTGFAITKAVANRLTFPADPVTTKQECYQFEHMSPANHMLAQINRMGLKTIMAAPQAQSPMFDTGYTRRLKHRWKDHVRIFGDFAVPEPASTPAKVTIICPTYQNYPQIVSSLICQTYPHWELWLIHDGPGMINDLPDDPRIKFSHTPVRRGNWGHEIRSEYLQKVTSEFVLISNPDNYYAPKFLEKSVASCKTVASYCAQIVHNYTDYKVMNCRPERGFIDCGQVLMRTDKVKRVGWRNITDHSADWLFFKDILLTYGKGSFTAFPGCHFIHN